MRMNNQTKLVFALEHVAHLHDLIEDNEYQHFLNDALCTLEFELERQLRNELDRKNNPNVSVPPKQVKDDYNDYEENNQIFKDTLTISRREEQGSSKTSPVPPKPFPGKRI